MARDYHKEYTENRKRHSLISVTVTNEMASEFKLKCEDEGISRSEFVKACIDAYLDNSLTYENGKLKMN